MSNKKIFEIFGISQNPDTNDYILVQKDFTSLMNFISGNEIIDDLIQEMLSNNKLFGWIPYNQFNEINETGKNNSITMHSAIWEDGPLYYDDYYYDDNYFDEYERDSNKEVALKCFQNSQNTIEILTNEVCTLV
jgi:hypothetical protein